MGAVLYWRSDSAGETLDLTASPFDGKYSKCPVHGRDFDVERVSVWQGLFSPNATEEWHRRRAEGLRKFPCAVPYHHVVDADSKLGFVVRPYCAECRSKFTEWMKDGSSIAIPAEEGE